MMMCSAIDASIAGSKPARAGVPDGVDYYEYNALNYAHYIEVEFAGYVPRVSTLTRRVI
jgi:hypothetical protein